jgi:hypothetical protein
VQVEQLNWFLTQPQREMFVGCLLKETAQLYCDKVNASYHGIFTAEVEEIREARRPVVMKMDEFNPQPGDVPEIIPQIHSTWGARIKKVGK